MKDVKKRISGRDGWYKGRVSVRVEDLKIGDEIEFHWTESYHIHYDREGMADQRMSGYLPIAKIEQTPEGIKFTSDPKRPEYAAICTYRRTISTGKHTDMLIEGDFRCGKPDGVS